MPGRGVYSAYRLGEGTPRISIFLGPTRAVRRRGTLDEDFWRAVGGTDSGARRLVAGLAVLLVLLAGSSAMAQGPSVGAGGGQGSDKEP